MWMAIDAVPERNAEHITALRGLPADKLKAYEDRFAQGQYADLLVEVEASLGKARSGSMVTGLCGNACRP